MEEIMEEIQHHLDQAKELRHGGQSGEAISLSMDALMLCREFDYGQGEVQTLGNLGLAYKNLGRLEEAIGHLRDAFAQSRKLSFWSELEVSLTNLGSTFSELGRMQDALREYPKSCVNP